MVFPSHNDHTINLKLNGTEIKRVNSCHYLGIIIDDALKWTPHIEKIYRHLLKYVGIFYKLRNKLPKQVLKTFTLLLFILTFCMELKFMQTLAKSTLRI